MVKRLHKFTIVGFASFAHLKKSPTTQDVEGAQEAEFPLS
jgi:hypothetical protein